jgi:hypothetical protein
MFPNAGRQAAQEESMQTIYGMLAVCLFAGTLHAQELNRAPSQEPKPAHETTVLTGCLAAGANASTFRLTRAAKVAPVPADKEVAATSGAETEYELRAESRLDADRVSPVDMKPFVGRRVEVTTRPVEDIPVTERPRAAGEPQVEKTDLPKQAEKAVKQLAVTAIKQLAATCE